MNIKQNMKTQISINLPDLLCNINMLTRFVNINRRLYYHILTYR